MLGGVRRAARGLRCSRRIGWRTRPGIRSNPDEGALDIGGRSNHRHNGERHGGRRRRINRNRSRCGCGRELNVAAAARIRRGWRPMRRGGLGATVVIAVVVVVGFNRGDRCLQRHQDTMTQFERHEHGDEQGHCYAKSEHYLHQERSLRRTSGSKSGLITASSSSWLSAALTLAITSATTSRMSRP